MADELAIDEVVADPAAHEAALGLPALVAVHAIGQVGMARRRVAEHGRALELPAGALASVEAQEPAQVVAGLIEAAPQEGGRRAAEHAQA